MKCDAKHTVESLIGAVMAVWTLCITGCTSTTPVSRESTTIDLVPLTEMEGGQAVGELVVEGKPIRVAFDTGSSVPLVLFDWAVESLAVHAGGESSSSTDRSIVHVRIGESDTSISAFVVGGPRINIDGVVGWPFLRNAVWKLDWTDRSQSFYSFVPEHVRSGFAGFPIDAESGVLSFDPGFPGRAGPVLIDTGSVGGVGLPETDWREWLDAHPSACITLNGIFSPSVGGFAAIPCALAEQLSIGRLELGPVVVSPELVRLDLFGRPMEIQTVLGAAAFSGRVVWIDGPRNMVYVGPSSGGDISTDGLNAVQATFLPRTLTDPHPSAHVIPGGFADRAGLVQGDKLVRVNGLDASTWREDERVRPSHFLCAPAGSRVVLTVEREGAEITIEFRMPAFPRSSDNARPKESAGV